MVDAGRRVRARRTASGSGKGSSVLQDDLPRVDITPETFLWALLFSCPPTELPSLVAKKKILPGLSFVKSGPLKRPFYELRQRRHTFVGVRKVVVSSSSGPTPERGGVRYDTNLLVVVASAGCEDWTMRHDLWCNSQNGRKRVT